MNNVFAKARDALSIFEVWEDLELPGIPDASCCSPFRHDLRPSFSIYDGGRRWKDHGTDEGGDVFDFVACALAGDKSAARKWIDLRLRNRPTWVPDPIQLPTPESRSKPELDLELDYGTIEEWKELSAMRALPMGGVCDAACAGVLRFTTWDGRRCFVVTDRALRAAEIRALDGGLFQCRHTESKTAPLPGVDKSWLPGAEVLRRAASETSVLVCEGATDLLSAYGLLHRYCQAGGANKWAPVTVLGASCRTLSPECAALLRGRHMRLCFDADEAGNRATEHWGGLLVEQGCSVDLLSIASGCDLSDLATKANPELVFSREHHQ